MTTILRCNTPLQVGPATKLWRSLHLPLEFLEYLHLTENPDPAVNSSFKLGTTAQTSIGLAALSAAYFHKLRTGISQDVSVNVRHAVIEFKSEAYYLIDGQPPKLGALFDKLSGVYKTKDSNYVRIHTNFPHHRQGILDILKCEPTKESIADAMLQWNSADIESEASSRKMVVTALRSFHEWDEHPQGIALAQTPPVTLIKVGDAPKRANNKPYQYPLEDIRVLDLTRVLAGPVCGRTLAAYGADVLWVTSPKLPDLPVLDTDTSRGKRTTQLDLTKEEDRSTLRSLVKDADIFLQAYRPGGLSEKGFGVEDVVSARPGIIYASLTAYGWDGPWSGQRGFDSLVQTASGFNVAEGESYARYKEQTLKGNERVVPKPLPMQALDHAAGYFLAFGINAALAKTITEGGSWEVRVSLAAVGQWIRHLGQMDPTVAFRAGKPLPQNPESDEIKEFSLTIPRSSDFGEESLMTKCPSTLTAVRHAATFSKTSRLEGISPTSLHTSAPGWKL
ncbi:CoA-transferase family III domain-containing protein [Abortiporus biennis]|nr:CoA-transferase family III domain-containing protein [Abortiporus biennis]KAI0785130.1 CoA-transferase family III domain-containing protein [Abortiporus biennis]